MGPSAEASVLALFPGIPKGQGEVTLQDPKGHFIPCLLLGYGNLGYWKVGVGDPSCPSAKIPAKPKNR